MGKRRTNAEIARVNKVWAKTCQTASEIECEVNPDEKFWVSVSPYNIGNLKSEYEADYADTLVVSVETKNPTLAKEIAQAIRLVLERDTKDG